MLFHHHPKYVHRADHPDNPDYVMNNLRHFFTRMQLRAKEVQIIRGLCRQVNWYGEKRYEDGLSEKDK